MLLGVIILVGVIFMCMITVRDKSSVKETETERYEQITSEEDSSVLEKNDVVNERIKGLLNSETYKMAEDEERVALVSELLTGLETSGYIKNLSLNEENNLFSFQYIDGTLGGVTIEDFSQSEGSLPMNW